MIGRLIFSLLILLCSLSSTFSQCDNTVPASLVDLTAAPDAIGTTTIEGVGTCCTNQAPNLNCGTLTILLNPFSDGVSITFNGPNQCAIDVWYDVACPAPLPDQQICDPICQSGEVIELLLCKTGNFNQLSIDVRGIPDIAFDGFVGVESCSDVVTAIGAEVPVDWSCTGNDPDTGLSLLNYLDCGSGPGVNITCIQPTFTYTGPPVTDCNGKILTYCFNGVTNECNPIAQMAFGEVKLYPDIMNPTIVKTCSPDGSQVTFTAESDSPCNLVYLWSNGETTSSITVPNDCSTYSVELNYADANFDPCIGATVSEVASCFFVDCPDPDGGSFGCDLGIPAPATTVAEFLMLPGNPAISGACSAVTISSTDGPVVCGTELTVTRTYSIFSEPETITCEVVYTLADTEAPMLSSMPADVTVECFSDVPGDPGVTATDNCGEMLMVTYSQSAAGVCVGDDTITNTWTVTDCAGNTTTHVQTVTVDDTMAPILSATPADITVECFSDVPGDPAVTATDNCGEMLMVTYSQSAAGVCPGDDLITNTWTVTDCAGNTTTHIQTVTVDDTMAPILSATPADITVECFSDVPGDPGLTATDNCGEMLIVTYSQSAAGDCVGDDLITNTWSVTDCAGNTTTHVQTVIIDDTMAPILSATPADVTVECFSDVPGDPGLTATDNCGEILMVNYSQSAAGDCVGDDLITNTWSVTDCAGNTTTHVQTVTIDDTMAPILSATPADVTVECFSDVPGDPGLTATDNCGEILMVNYSQSAAGVCVGDDLITNTWTVTDCAGNTTTHVQTVIIDDTMAPILSATPADVTVECFSDVPGDPGLTATDNCGEILMVNYSQSAAGVCVGDDLITNTWTVTDCAGNTTTHIQTVTVDDTMAPILSALPADVTVECFSDVPEDPGVTATDNCGEMLMVTYSQSAAGVCPGDDTITNTWTVTDCAGNTTTHIQTVTVDDTMAPILSATPADVTVECFSEVPGDPGLTATDNCGEMLMVTYSQSSAGVCPGDDLITNTWTVTDCAGNTTTHVQTVTIDDTMAPILSALPADVTVECFSDVPGDPGVTATDNCGEILMVDYSQSAAGVCPGDDLITNTWTVTDCAGNTTTHVQTVTVDDTMAPILSALPADVTVECFSDVPGDPGVTATDNCGEILMVDYSQSAAGVCPGDDLITNTWTVTDCAGNTTTHVQSVTVDDTMAPILSATPTDITVECFSDVPGDPGVTATDNCGEMLLVTYSQSAAGVCPGDDLITNTWTVTDCAGNTTTHVQTVTIDDTMAPILSAMPADVTVECFSDVPGDPGVTATDNCGEMLMVTYSQSAAGVCPGDDLITNTWTVTDCAGNTTTHVQTVTIDDTMAPILSALPADVTVECFSEVPGDPGVTATDNCGEMLMVTYSQSAAGLCPGDDLITNTWTVTDCAGNTTTHIQTVTVDDTMAPILSATPADVTVECFSEVPGDPGLTATDNCGEMLMVTYSQSAAGLCPGDDLITNTWTVTDCAGNTTTHVQTVTIDDTMAPILSALPADVTVDCFSDVPGDPGVTATDNCGEILMVNYSQSAVGVCPGDDLITNTWTVTDCAGNTTTHVQTVTIDDTMAPILSALPADVTVECFSDVPGDPGVTATDNCGEMLMVNYSQSSAGVCPGDDLITNTWTVTDCAGNTTTHIQTVTVDDTMAPILSATPADVTVECFSDVPGDPEVTATDNCGEILMVDYSQSAAGVCPGDDLITNTWTVTDCAGNTTTHIQTVTVDDTMAPILSALPADVTVECFSDVPGDPGVTATDNCGEILMVDYSQSAAGVCPGDDLITNTWTVTDCAGNTTTHVQTVTVDDTMAPILSATPTDITVECFSEVPGDPGVTATDNCGEMLMVTYSQSAAGVCFGDDLITNTWTVTDCAGNTSSHVQTVVIDDTMAPILSATPIDITVECFSDVPGDPGVTATDNCGEILMVTYIQSAAGDCLGDDAITNTWTVTDCAGNTTTHVQTVTVDDTMAPILSATPIDITVECFSDVPGDPGVTATDNCGEMLMVDYSQSAGGLCPGDDLITNTWSVTDCAGNTTTHVQTVVIDDTMAPILSATPADVTVECFSEVPGDPGLTATDNCGEILMVDYIQSAAGVCPGDDLITNTWTVTDCAGNTTTHIQTVTVDDTMAPILSAMPADVTVECFSDVPGDPGITATDNCGEILMVTYSQVSMVGLATNTWIAVDCGGNMTTYVQTVTVNSVFVDLANVGPFCIDAANATLVGTPSGGLYEGAGVIDELAGTFDPSTAGVGMHEVVYTYGFGNTCVDSDTIIITVNALPIVSLQAAGPFCVSESGINLEGNPAGGTYSGVGITDAMSGTFDPGTAGVGTHTITYVYADGNSCVDSAQIDIIVNPLPIVELAEAGPFCVSEDIEDLVGTPIGGTYSGSGITDGMNGTFDPGVAGVGTHTITYVYADGNSCVDSAQIDIIVNPLPIVELAEAGPFCVSEDSEDLVGTPIGGTYTGSGITDGMNGTFDPGVAGVGTHTITYVYADANSCVDSTQIDIIVNPLPIVELAEAGPFCVSEGSEDLVGTPIGGTYTGSGITDGMNGTFDPGVAGVGTHTITYVYADANSCVDSAQIDIIINPLPIVELAEAGPFCISEDSDNLVGTPIGGTYTGSGITDGMNGTFDPGVAGVGTHTITYVYADGNSCVDSAQIDIIVNPLPIVELAEAGPFCISEDSDNLVGTPIGGTYTGSGITDGMNGTFDPTVAGVGTHTITYVYSDINSCIDSAMIDIVVNPLPIVTLAEAGPFCVSEGSENLVGIPIGGTYSGSGITDGMNGTFDPGVAGVGTHTITYVYADGNSCVDSAQIDIVVNPLPIVELAEAGPFCVSEDSENLVGSPIGGTYTGSGITDGMNGTFDPGVAGVGTHTITYVYSDVNSCVDSAQIDIIVNPLPIVELAEAGPFCVSGTSTNLQSSPIGGVYSGSGITDGINGTFDPGVAGVGIHTITYVYSDSNSCVDSAQIDIIVNILPDVNLAEAGPFCVSEDSENLVGTPIGGTYSGSGITDGMNGTFDPGVAGVGTHTITYVYADGNSCVDSAQIDIIVNPLPIVELAEAGPFCVSEGSEDLVGTPIGGTYSGSGITDGMSGTFDPGVAGVGTHTITYVYADVNSCVDSAQIDIIVNPLPIVELTQAGPFCVSEGSEDLVGIPIGGTYSGSGITDGMNGTFDPGVAGVGTHTITYVYADGSSCIDSAIIDIVVNPLPIVTLDEAGPYCVSEDGENLVGSPDGGTFTGVGITDGMNGTFDPGIAGVGTHTITYVYADGNSCVDSAQIDIVVNPLPIVELEEAGPFCVSEDSENLVGSPVGGMYSGVGITDGINGTFDPSIAGVGVHTITYTYSGMNGCINSDSIQIVVNALPIVTLEGEQFCLDSPPTILNGSPSGGQYSGVGIVNMNTGLFDPAVSGLGIHEITYLFTDVNGCSNSAVQNILVDSLPVPLIDPLPEICIGNGTVNLSVNLPGGIFSGNGIVDMNNGIFDPKVAGIGETTITYEFSDINSCSASTSIVVEVINCFDLALTKNISPIGPQGPFVIGDEVVFTISVVNQGQTDAYNVTVVDYIPSNMSFISSTDFSLINNQYIGEIPFLEAGTSQELTITLELVSYANDLIINNAEIISGDDDDDETNAFPMDQDSDLSNIIGGVDDDSEIASDNDIDDEALGQPGIQDNPFDQDDYDPTVLPVLDLAIIKTIADTLSSPLSYGDTIRYSIQVFNQGTVSVDSFQVTDYLPEGLEFINDPSLNVGWDGSDHSNPVFQYGGGSFMQMMDTTISFYVRLVPVMYSTQNSYLNVAEVSFAGNLGEDLSAFDIDSALDSNPDNNGGGAAGTPSDDVVTGNGTGVPGDTNADTDADNSDPAQLRIVDLALAKSIADIIVLPLSFGDTIKYRMVLINQGNVDIDTMDIIDYLPYGISLIDDQVLNAGWDATDPMNPVYHWGGDVLNPGEMDTICVYTQIMMEMEVTDSTYVNTAEISYAEDINGTDVSLEDIDSELNTNPFDNAGGSVGTDSDNSISGDGTGEPGDSNAQTDQDNADPAGIMFADVALIKTLAPDQGPFAYGEPVTFNIDVINQGNITLYNLTVTDYISDGFLYDSANDANGWSFSGNNAQIVVAGPLSFNDTLTVSISLIPVSVSPNNSIVSWINVAEVSSVEDEDGNILVDIDSNLDSNPTNDFGGDVFVNDNETGGDSNMGEDEDDSDPALVPIFDLALTKELLYPDSLYLFGDVVDFFITLHNQGNQAVTNIEITDYLANAFSVTGISNPGWIFTNNSGTYLFSDTLFVEESATIDLQMSFQFAEMPEDYVNIAEISAFEDTMGNSSSDPNVLIDADSTPNDIPTDDAGGQPDTPGSASGTDNTIQGENGDEDDHDPALVGYVDIALIKVPNQQAILPGEETTFTVIITNQGIVPIGEVVVVDYIPEGMSLSDNNWTPGNAGTLGVSASRSLSISNGSLPSDGLMFGESIQVQITLLVDEDLMTGTVVNYAEIAEIYTPAGDDIGNADLDSSPDVDDTNDPGGAPETGSDDSINGIGNNGNGMPGDESSVTDEDDHDPAAVCYFPMPEIVGKKFVCPLDTQTYFVIPYEPTHSYDWVLPSGGTIVESTDSSIVVVWNDEPGSMHQIQIFERTDLDFCYGFDAISVVIEDSKSLACNTGLNISLSAQCEAVITPDMILEGGPYNDESFTIIIRDENGNLLPSNIVTIEYLGQQLEVQVVQNCTGNSCWGYVTVQDKFPPTIICPENDTLTCAEYAAFDFELPSLEVDCGNEVFETTTEEVVGGCDDEFALTLTITTTATDASGNASAPCVQVIYVEKESLDSLSFPLDYDGQSENQDVLACDGDYILDDNGHPSPIETGAPTGVGVCSNIISTYSDVVLPICESTNCGENSGSYKIVRSWIVVEWCTNTVIEHSQIIKVMDQEKPLLASIPNITVSTSEVGCGAVIDLPVVSATDNCSASESIIYTFSSSVGIQVDNTFIIDDPSKTMPGAPVIITVTATDCCGNTDSTEFEVTIVDVTPPVVVAEESHVISLNSNQVATMYAEVLDDGSYDGCGPVGFSVKRMDDGPDCNYDEFLPVGNDNAQFNDAVHFCCSDADTEPVMIQLRVCDDADMDGVLGSNGDNCNFAMVEVFVQDKLVPQIFCPEDTTVSCIDLAGIDLTDTELLNTLFGEAEAAATCEVEITQVAEENEECGVGKIFRNFTATNAAGSTSCQQVITVNSLPENSLTCNRIGLDIENPVFTGLSACEKSRFSYGPTNTAPGCPANQNVRWWCAANDDASNSSEDIPALEIDCQSGFEVPEVLLNIAGLCSEVGINTTIDTFQFAGGACQKYLVHYEVINQCIFDEDYVDPITGELDPFNSDNGYFELYLDIDAFDSTPPVPLCDDVTVAAQSCTGYEGSIGMVATDNCTTEEYFGFQWRVDIDADNTIDFPQSGWYAGKEVTPSILGLAELPIGTHRIFWIVSDGCGNDATCSQLLTIEDEDKAPTPYCYDGLSVAVMASTGTVSLWANDFDAGSFDNCDEELTLTMVPEVDVIGLDAENAYDLSFTGVQQPNGDYGWEFNCDYIENNISAVLEVRIYVTDQSGNWDYCLAELRLDDNNDACEDQGTTILYEVTGKLETEEGDAIHKAIVKVDADYPEFPMIGSFDGSYSFNLTEMVDYEVTPIRNDNHLNGVSTLDILLIQKHILSLANLGSPYKLIAADVNNDCNVTGADLIQLRKLLLGKFENDEFPSNSSWRFVEASYEFINPNQPCDFIEFTELYNLSADMTSDYIGIKIGDVNVTATSNITSNVVTRSKEKMRLQLENIIVESGIEYRLPVKVKNITNVYGLQWTMNLTDAEFVSIEPGALNLSPTNIGVAKDGSILISYDNANGIDLSEDDILFYLNLKANEMKELRDVIEINSSALANEVYVGSDVEVYEAVIDFRGGDTDQFDFKLYQNVPNPFKEQTTIMFQLPHDSEAILTIYDVQGKVLYRQIDSYSKGEHSITVDRKSLKSSGLLYCKLEAGDYMSTKKMIVLD